MKTPTKRTTHRLAAVLAIATVFATTGAWAATDCKWTGGGTDTKWSTPANWNNSTVPTSSEHNARFVSSDVTVNNFVALLDGACTCNVLHVSGSSAANPWTFEAADSSSGLTIVDDGWLGYVAAGWLWLKSGTYTFEKSLRAGIDVKNGDKYPLWLKVGDGESDVTLNVTGTYGPIFGSSSEFVADKATLDFTGKNFAMYSSSSASIANSTMTVGAVKLNGTSSMTLSDTTMTVGNDLNVADAAEANCTLSGVSSTINLTSKSHVFNVGQEANSTGVVIKDGGDWSCYYLRIGNGSGSTGTFTQNSGTLTLPYPSKTTEFAIGTKGAGTFTLNGGTVTLDYYSNQYIGRDSGSSGTLNLNGGTFAARCLRRNNDGATATINFNGGTLKANYEDDRGLIASGVTVNAGENGGTIDSGNKEISVGAAIGGTGGMRFMGGNTITLNGANTYTGGTIIELGSKVVASDATAKDTILSNLVIDGRAVLAGGEYDVLVASGLTAADLEKVTLVNCAAGSTKDFDDPETPTKIVVTLAEPTCLTTSYSLVFPGKTLDDIKEADFTCRFCGAAALNCIRLDSGKGYNKKLYFDGNGILTDIYVEMQVADGNFVKCVVVQFQNSDDGVKGRIFGSNAKYVSSQSLGYVFLEPDTTTWYGRDQDIATTRTGSGYGICDLRVTAAAATVEWTLDADKNWSDFSGYDALGADDFVRITATGNYTLTMDTDVNVGKIEFMDASGSTMIVSSGKTVTTEGISGICNIQNNGTIVKKGEGTAYMPFNNASEGVTVVNSGTLKVASHTGDGSSHTVRVKSGATFDMNGWGDTVVSVILEEDANFANSRGDIGNKWKQTKSITLEGDATATASKNFGLIGSSHAETTLALGSNTLTLNGSGGFWLDHTTIIGDGTIAVESGTLQCANMNSTGTDCTLNIGASGTLRIDNNQSLTVKNFYNGGTYYVYSNYGLGMLEVTGTLTTGNQVTKLTLSDGSTVKATGTAQIVSTTFSASGAVTIDASEIAAETLRAGDVAVLTVPAAFNPSGATWNVSGAPVADARTKWRTDEGGATKTLYVGKPTGLIVIFR